VAGVAVQEADGDLVQGGLTLDRNTPPGIHDLAGTIPPRGSNEEGGAMAATTYYVAGMSRVNAQFRPRRGRQVADQVLVGTP
jgi:hypothetical protein